MNIVIIGGVAAGAKAAAKTRRLLPDSKIDIYTEDTHVSYSACGLPYYIQGNFDDYKKLIVRTPEEFGKSNINVHLQKRVIKIIPKTQKIIVKDLVNDVEYPVSYDRLVIATGAIPFMPEIKNINLKNIMFVILVIFLVWFIIQIKSIALLAFASSAQIVSSSIT